ncbi:hypothetical protein AAG596_03190 [Citromicrobium bathyomarinum]
MTAEVAILNRQGIALAADSALTIGQERVWKTSNKIFSLGPRNDIAIMVYGGADFCGIPWETIVKDFKRSTGGDVYGTVRDCSDKFREFLNEQKWRDPLQSKLCAFSIFIKELQDLKAVVDTSSAATFRNSAKQTLDEWCEIAQSREKCLPELTREVFLSEFRDQIDYLRGEAFAEHFPKYLKDRLDEYLFEYFTRERCESNYETGIVICGYGSDEIFPALDEIIVDGRHKDSTRAWRRHTARMKEDPNRPAQIFPFAQRDMASLFMEGISPAYLGYFITIIEVVLELKTKEIVDNFSGTADEKTVERTIQRRRDDEIVKRVDEDFGKFRSERFVQPLMRNVNSLPRDEMAAMAEALVELTSLRRKIDSVVQSVGGPVDVAVISKADGFVWMKRKHYFDPERNYEFFDRKSKLES